VWFLWLIGVLGVEFWRRRNGSLLFLTCMSSGCWRRLGLHSSISLISLTYFYGSDDVSMVWLLCLFGLLQSLNQSFPRSSGSQLPYEFFCIFFAISSVLLNRTVNKEWWRQSVTYISVKHFQRAFIVYRLTRLTSQTEGGFLQIKIDLAIPWRVFWTIFLISSSTSSFSRFPSKGGLFSGDLYVMLIARWFYRSIRFRKISCSLTKAVPSISVTPDYIPLLVSYTCSIFGLLVFSLLSPERILRHSVFMLFPHHRQVRCRCYSEWLSPGLPSLLWRWLVIRIGFNRHRLVHMFVIDSPVPKSCLIAEPFHSFTPY